MKDAIMHEKEIHPGAQPEDYIKLIFQSEFGPGHLIADPSFSHDRLVNEWKHVRHLPAEETQDIGGGYVRLCIKGLDESQLEAVNKAFVASANVKSGTEEGFVKKLELFLEMARQGIFGFDAEDAKKAVDGYLEAGIRPVSHTRVYHSHFAPAYRVVRKAFIQN